MLHTTKSRASSQYKDGLSRYEDLQNKGKAVVRPSYLYGNPYIGKTISLCWDVPLFNDRQSGVRMHGGKVASQTTLR